jgi:hypothetical protein
MIATQVCNYSGEPGNSNAGTSITSLEQKFEEYKTTYIVLITIWSNRCTTHHSPGMNRKFRGTRLI